jgi:hypothetical protein
MILSLFLFDLTGEQQTVGLEYPSMMDDLARPRVAYILVSNECIHKNFSFQF